MMHFSDFRAVTLVWAQESVPYALLEELSTSQLGLAVLLETVHTHAVTFTAAKDYHQISGYARECACMCVCVHVRA